MLIAAFGMLAAALLMALDVICFLCTFFLAGYLFVVAALVAEEEEREEAYGSSHGEEKVTETLVWFVVFGGGIASVIAGAAGTWFLTAYLLAAAPYIFEVFAAWYAVGWLSRVGIYMLTDEMFSARVKTEWSSILPGLVLLPLLGPFELAQLVRELLARRRLFI